MFKNLMAIALIILPLSFIYDGGKTIIIDYNDQIRECCIDYKGNNDEIEDCIQNIIGNDIPRSRDGLCHYCKD